MFLRGINKFCHDVAGLVFCVVNVSITLPSMLLTVKRINLNGIVVVFEPRHKKTCLREFPTRSDSNWPAQLRKLA